LIWKTTFTYFLIDILQLQNHVKTKVLVHKRDRSLRISHSSIFILIINYIPLSRVASGQLQVLNQLLQDFSVDQGNHDEWVYIWNSIFSAKKAYISLKGVLPVSLMFNWMWKSCVPGKISFFLWLLLHDRLNTRNLLRRKRRILDDYSCVLCQTATEETLQHLFFLCPFSMQCWNFLGISWDSSLNITEMVLRARQSFGLIVFREISMVASWCIWLHRKSLIFDGGALSVGRWKQCFKEEFSLVLRRAKPSLNLELDSWFCNKFL
jgi:hypothetical protein